MRNKHYPKSYKEKTNPFPYESGRKERPKIDAPTPARDGIKEDGNINYTPYNQKNEIESVWWDLTSDAEEEIYATIDYSLWNTDNISPALIEALEFYEENEEISGDYYGWEKQAKMSKNTKNRNAKSKTKFNRTHKIERELNNKQEIEKYRFAT